MQNISTGKTSFYRDTDLTLPDTSMGLLVTAAPSNRGSITVAAVAELGVQIFGFRITFDIASRSPFGIFAIGAIAVATVIKQRSRRRLVSGAWSS